MVGAPPALTVKGWFLNMTNYKLDLAYTNVLTTSRAKFKDLQTMYKSMSIPSKYYDF